MLPVAPCSIRAMTLSERIKEALDGAKLSVTDAAKKVGVGRSAIYPWLSGDTKNLKLENLFALADATGYSAKWIAIEKGTKRDLKPLTQSNGTDLSFLTMAIQELEKYLDDQGIELEAERKARVVTLLYEICAEKGRIEPPTIERYLRLVV